MTMLTEGKHTGGFLVWEVLRDYTRETVTIASGAGKLEAWHGAWKNYHRREIHKLCTWRVQRQSERFWHPVGLCGCERS
jgi:hypothetical protein